MTSESRRKFLRLAAAGTCGGAVHRLFSTPSGMLAYAFPQVGAALPANSILVIVNLAGGCSYNITPVYHGTYLSRNPNVGYTPEQSIPLSAEQGLHPALTALKPVFDEGRLALINMVGYPNPNRSHAESADIWFQGARNMSAAAIGGWGARLTSQIASTFAGVSLAGQNTFVLGGDNPPRSFSNLSNYGMKNFDWRTGARTQHLQATLDSMIAQGNTTDKPRAAFVRENMMKLSESIQRIRQELNPNTNPLPQGVTFGNSGFGNRCQDAARLMLANPLGTRLVFVEDGGYDTHSDERPSLANNLARINAGLSGLIQVAKLTGNWDRLVIATMSEFCRTFENQSQGTDHGHSAPLLVLGGRVLGGIRTPPPTAAQTVGEFYRDYHVDFREVFFEIVRNMGLDAGRIFPEALAQSLGLRLFD